MEDTKNKNFRAKFLAIAIAAALALSAAPALANSDVSTDIEGWKPGGGGTGSLEVGSANADGKMSIAVGESTSNLDGATAKGLNSIAIGSAYASLNSGELDGAKAEKQFSIAVGTGAKASDDRSIAIGKAVTAGGEDSIAIGSPSGSIGSATDHATAATGANAVAIGASAQASGQSAIALGRSSTSSAATTVAIGNYASATKRDAIAIGDGSKAYSTLSIAIGQDAQANGSDPTIGLAAGVAIGSLARVDGTTKEAVALGYNSVATEDLTVSIGRSDTKLYRRITNMAAGRNDYDAVNVSQLKGGLDTLLGVTTAVDSTGKITTGSNFAYNGVATYSSVQSVFNQIGTDVAKIDTLGESVADILRNGSYDPATGTVTGSWSVSTPSGGTIEFGGEAGGNITVKESIDQDTNTTTYTINTVVDPTFEAVTVGADNNKTTINGGTITATDANGTTTITGGAITAASGTFSGDVSAASLTADGDVSGGTGVFDDSVTVGSAGNQTIINGGAITAASGTFSGTVSAGTSVTVGDTGGVVIDGSSLSIGNGAANLTDSALTVGSMSYNETPDSLSFSTPTTITGVKAGAISANSTEAVNGSQLYNIGNNVASVLGSGVTYDGSSNSFTSTGAFAGKNTVTGGFSALNDKINALGGSVAQLLEDNGGTGVYDDDSGKVTGTIPTSSTSGTPSTGNSVTITGVGNIEVTQDPTATDYTIDTVDDPTFTEVTIGDSTSNTTISKTADGLDMGGAVLSNLTDGTDEKDAATVGQMNAADDSVRKDLTAAYSEADDSVRRDLTAAYNEADDSVRKDLTAAYNEADDSVRRDLTAAYNDADDSVRRDLTAAYSDADDSVRKDLTAAYNEADDSVRREFAAADAALSGRIDGHDREFSSLQNVLGSGYSNPNFNTLRVGNIYSDGANIDMGGGRITGLSDGGVYMGSTDAVTGSQLWSAYQRMDDMQEGINIVGAHAAALSGLHPIDYNPFEPTTLSAAVGTYRDEYAVAVGVFHYVREDVLFNLGASLCSDGDVMGRAGISFTVGRGGDKKKALAPKDMNEVQAQLAEVRQALNELKAENAALKVRLDAKSK